VNPFEKERTAVERPYHTIPKNDTQTLARFLTQNGQALLAVLEENSLAAQQRVEEVA